MAFLDEQILNKDEKLSVKKNEVIKFLLTVFFRRLPSWRISRQYTLFQNGRNFSVAFFICIFALVASLKRKYFFDFEFKNNASRANLQENKRTLIWRPFWNKMDKRLFFLLSCVESWFLLHTLLASWLLLDCIWQHFR